MDYLGPTVNFAARVESKAMGGQIVISENAKQKLTADILVDCVVKDMGEVTLKGIGGMQHLYSIVPKV